MGTTKEEKEVDKFWYDTLVEFLSDLSKKHPNDADLGAAVRKYLFIATKASDYEPCVMCGEATPYRKSDNIDIRMNYVEGAGQLCEGCYNNHTNI